MEKLLVYGTLRKEQRLSAIMQGSKYIETVRIDGYRMYNCGSYPCVIFSENSSITGELYEVDDFTDLDLVEGVASGLYTRYQDDRGFYIYMAGPNLTYKNEIKSGDWLIPDIFKILRPDNHWNPKFMRVDTIEECADLINQPHEDYPKRVQQTIDMIEMYKTSYTIKEKDILQMHSHVMFDQDHRGRYRNLEVRVGSYIPPKHYLVPNLIVNSFPVNKGELDIDLVKWYKDFETIHPFQDGNGRIGGIVVAALSYDGKTILAPI